ncbi:hypothetical protein O181_112342 [Austropuccinia psidii MF-1]|uniref:Uncharacterized protein n=1 Tax=Austropuccinia psidii MF-1 TaxID=1389203 RepID=A0A9Q3K3J0_9BASI|nr:hypothetical protein [Austropuccinia psidii MF-1]
MLANKHTRNVHLLCAPSDHAAGGVLAQRRPCEDSFVVNNDETISEREWTPGPQAGRQEQFRTISPVPSRINLSTPLLGQHPMVTSLLDLSEVIIRLMKDGNGERTFELGPILTMSCHRWDSNAKNKTPNPPRKDSPVPSFPQKKIPGQPTPGPKPSQTKEPPIPGPSLSSQPPEDDTTRQPEPEVAPTQSIEEPFGKSPLLFLHSSQLFLTFSLTISSSSCHSLLHHYHRRYTRWIPPSSSPTCPPSHPVPPPPLQPRFSYQRSLPVSPRTPMPPPPRCKAPLIPTMTLARNSLPYD